MSARAVRKRCRECHRSMNGTPGRAEWCPCGGEMVAIVYRKPVPKAKRAG